MGDLYDPDAPLAPSPFGTPSPSPWGRQAIPVPVVAPPAVSPESSWNAGYKQRIAEGRTAQNLSPWNYSGALSSALAGMKRAWQRIPMPAGGGAWVSEEQVGAPPDSVAATQQKQTPEQSWNAGYASRIAQAKGKGGDALSDEYALGPNAGPQPEVPEAKPTVPTVNPVEESTATWIDPKTGIRKTRTLSQYKQSPGQGKTDVPSDFGGGFVMTSEEGYNNTNPFVMRARREQAEQKVAEMAPEIARSKISESQGINEARSAQSDLARAEAAFSRARAAGVQTPQAEALEQDTWVAKTLGLRNPNELFTYPALKERQAFSMARELALKNGASQEQATVISQAAAAKARADAQEEIRQTYMTYQTRKFPPRQM